MRIVWRAAAAGALAAWLGAAAVPARAQNPETMMPEQSAAKAKELLQQTIQAMGGPAYLNARDADCSVRLSFFGHNGDLTGYDIVRDLWIFPDKNRTEFSKKGNIVDLYNGDQGWTLDKGGVTDASAAAVEAFQEQVKTDLDNVLRNRLKEEGMIFRYGGSDIVDLRQVDWVELEDRDRRVLRLALDRSTHLPVRSVVQTRDPGSRLRNEEVTYYSNYHPLDGIQTPFQVARERNGVKIYQAFYYGCKYNSGLSPDLFTRAALEKRYAEGGGKGKKK